MRSRIAGVKRFQRLAGLTEDLDLSDTPEFEGKFYAVVNLGGRPKPLEANSKEEMLSKLNQEIGSDTYSLDDLEDDFYMGEKLDTVISDDWATVTKNKNVFEKDLEIAQQYWISKSVRT